MSDELKPLKPLSKKHKRVLDEYLICFVQWKAYKAVYPESSEEVCRTSSSRLFADANFNAHLEARLNESFMSSNEALKLMADIARGDIGDFVNDFGGVDILKAREAGKTRLIKKIKTRTITINGKQEDKEVVEEEVELYPADAALRDILKIHGKYKEQIDITSGGEKIKGYIGWSPENWEDAKE